MRLIVWSLRRPVSIAVAVVALVGMASLALLRMPMDVFPRLDAPVIYVAQPYGGMAPSEMEGYIVNYYESNFLFISGIAQVESRSIQNVGLIKLSFQPGTDMSQAAAQTTTYISRALAYMPQGTVPPFVLRYDAGSLPVGDVILSSPQRSQPELDDLAQTRVRPLFSSLPGVSAPPPFGGNPRSVVITLDPDAMTARHLAPDDVVRAVVAGNVVVPGGNARMGDYNRIVHLNNVVPAWRQLLDLPLRSGPRGDVLLRDVASISDDADVVSGYAELNGRRVVYMPVTKHTDASTLAVVREVQDALPRMREQVPPDVKVEFAFDQSVHVRDALQTLLIEALFGAALTGLVIWAFLDDGRSAAIVVVVIPFALLAAVAGLWVLGQSLNIMTVGGLALAVGILVDEATVSMENIHAHLARGERLAASVIESGREILGPKILAALCVASVFLPILFMTGISRSLFVPLGLAVGLAMLASLLLSLTLVPVLAVWQGVHRHPTRGGSHGAENAQAWRRAVARAAGALIHRRGWVVPVYFVLSLAAVALLVRSTGTDVFPTADTGQFQLRLRAPAGTRLKRTELLYQRALALLEREAGSRDGRSNVATSLGFVGTQPRSYPVNTIYLWTSGPQEAVMQVALRPGSGLRVPDFEEHLRTVFARELPQVSVSFEAGDIIGQMMNLGSPAPISVQVTGFDIAADHDYAERLRLALGRVPALRDLQYGQPYDVPAVLVDVDRQRASDDGITVAQVARSLTIATASSRFVARNFWQDPASGLTYQVQVLLPPKNVSSLDQVRDLPMASVSATASADAAKPVLLGDVASVQLGLVKGEYDHFNMQRMVSLTANVRGSSLGEAAAAVEDVIARQPPPPRGTHVSLVGQVEPMRATLTGLEVGLALAIAVIALLLMASYQSWRLATVAVSSVPVVLAGALLLLRAFGSTLNLESYMGIITAVGISVANGVLLVTMAESQRQQLLASGTDRAAAAVAAARSGLDRRLRPILMTASAMIAGMTPMALAWESGGGQSAPLGQAVIGGLAASTVATLLVMPAVYTALLRHAAPEVNLAQR